MEPGFYDFVDAELDALLGDIRAGLQPSNIALQEAVFHECRKQYDRKKRAHTAD